MNKMKKMNLNKDQLRGFEEKLIGKIDWDELKEHFPGLKNKKSLKKKYYNWSSGKYDVTIVNSAGQIVQKKLDIITRRESAEEDQDDVDEMLQEEDVTVFTAKGVVLKKIEEIQSQGLTVSHDELMEIHGLNPKENTLLKVVSNSWGDHESYSCLQSKIFVEPILPEGYTTEKIEKLYEDIFAKIKLPTQRISPVLPESEEVLEISVIDFHLGKWDIEDMRKSEITLPKQILIYKEKIEEIIAEFGHKKYRKIIYNFTSDFFHSDTIQKTTTAGTSQDTCADPKVLFEEGLELQIFVIEKLRAICEELKIVYYPSNHDEITTSHLYTGLSKLYKYSNVSLQNVVTFSDNLSIMDVERIGVNFIGFIHDLKKPERAVSAFKSKIQAKYGLYGNPYFEIHDGHLHEEELKKFTDVKIRRFNSCSAKDKWHEDNLFGSSAANFYVMKWHPEFRGPKSITYI